MAVRHISPAPIYAGAPTGADRVVTSGELPAGAGTGDAVKAGFNFWSGLNVFTGQTTFSGGVRVYAGIYAGVVSGAARYVTSGELSAAGAGTGDATRTSPNYFTALNVFAAETVASGTLTARGLITASGGITAYAPLLDGSGRRFLVSGEGGGSGSGDATRTSANYFTALNVFAGVTVASGAAVFLGGVQISGGGFTTYGPLMTGAGQRFVTSGEVPVIPSGITAINDQTGPAVTINTGTAGNDFNVSTAGNVVTVNLPNASAFARGKVTFGAQTFSGTKAFADPIIALNGIQLSGLSLAYQPIYAGAVASAARYVTSGDLAGLQASLQSSGITTLNGLTAVAQSFATGTMGTDVNISSASSTHTFNIPDASAFARGLIATTAQTISGVKTFVDNVAVRGATQLSGLTLAYGPLYQGAVSGAARYVTSGDMVVIPSGITTVNSQAGPAITIAAGSTGTDVNIAQAANVVTVHVPDASAFARGVVTTAAQTISGAKTWADNLIACADVQVSGLGIAYRGLYAGVVTGAARYVTSGELQAAGVGTGDATRTSPNYFTALNVFAGVTVASGGIVTVGGTQISGGFIAYGPLYQGVATGGFRYITSGELSITSNAWLARAATTVETVNAAGMTQVFSAVIPANTLGANEVLQLDLLGAYRNATGSEHHFGTVVTFGGQVVMSGVLAAIASDPADFGYRGQVQIAGAGSTGAQWAAGSLTLGGASTTSGLVTVGAGALRHAVVTQPYLTVDATQDQTLRVVFAHDAADAALSAKLYMAYLRRITVSGGALGGGGAVSSGPTVSGQSAQFYSPIFGAAYGVRAIERTVYLSGPSVTVTGMQPANCIGLGVTATVVSGFQSAQWWNLGTVNNPTLHGAALSSGVGTVADWTTSMFDAVPVYRGAADLIITASGSAYTFTSGALRIVSWVATMGKVPAS